MLCSLFIENIALIRKLSFDPQGGFCAFTGETGAGKSIIIDAMSLLCGARSDRSIIRTGEESALVEGVFFADGSIGGLLAQLDIPTEDDGAVTVTRKISADGRSVSKINGRAVPLSKLKAVASQLISIHGQQDTYAFSDRDRQILLLDSFSKTGALLEDYQEKYGLFREAEKKLQELLNAESDREMRMDMLSYRINELKKAAVSRGELESLLAERSILANRERIVTRAMAAYDLLYGGDGSALEKLKEAARSVSELEGIVSDAGELLQRLESSYAELKDVAESLSDYAEFDGDSSPARLDHIESRIELIRRLSKKYSCDPDGFEDVLASWEEESELISDSKKSQDKLRQALEQAETDAAEAARVLSVARQDGARILEERVAEELNLLDMPNVRFEVRFESKDLGTNGGDRIEFFVSANKGEEPRPMGMCASGGELSRIMLCLKCVFTDSESIGTLIFDEIDAGVSGRTSEKIALRLKKAAFDGKTQVICVTHSAVLAAKADAHYRISKSVVGDRTETEITRLRGEERVAELARIMGGLNVSDTVLAAAREMLGG